MVHMTQSKLNDPGQIALDAGFFGDGFAEIKWKAQRHTWPVFRPPLPLAVHLARCCLFGCFLDCHWHSIPHPRRFFTALDHAKPIGSAIRKFPFDASAIQKSGRFPLQTAQFRVKHDTTPQAAVAGTPLKRGEIWQATRIAPGANYRTFMLVFTVATSRVEMNSTARPSPPAFIHARSVAWTAHSISSFVTRMQPRAALAFPFPAVQQADELL